MRENRKQGKKRNVRIFISYSHSNAKIIEPLIELMTQHFAISKHFDYAIWWDNRLLCGQAWEDEIMLQAKRCDAALLMLSPAFLGSKFVNSKELPLLREEKKLLFPVALYPVDFAHHDMQGLEENQIYFLNSPSFTGPRSYSDLKSPRRVDFALGLFCQIEDRLVLEFPEDNEETT